MGGNGDTLGLVAALGNAPDPRLALVVAPPLERGLLLPALPCGGDQGSSAALAAKGSGHQGYGTWIGLGFER